MSSNASFYTRNTLEKYQSDSGESDNLQINKYVVIPGRINMQKYNKSLSVKLLNNIAYLENKEQKKASQKEKQLEVKKIKKIQSISSCVKKQIKFKTIKQKMKKTKTSSKIKQKKDDKIDYIFLGSQIYQCENIQKISDQLMGAQSIFSYPRFCKIMDKSRIKIQKYLNGFTQYSRFNNITKNILDISQLSNGQQIKLYKLLIQQNQDQDDDFDCLNDVIKQALTKLQLKSICIQRKYPESQQKVKKWKNKKMHELMSAQQLLNQKCLEGTLKEIEQQLYLWQSTLSSEREQIKKQLFGHLQMDKFPQIEIDIEKEQLVLQTQRKHNSYFGISGYFWYLNSLKILIKSEQDLLNELIYQMNFEYGLNKRQKMQLMKMQESEWQSELQIYQSCKPQPLSDQLYVKFQQELVGKDSNKQNIHIFNKAIFDAFNNELFQFMNLYPNGQDLGFNRKQRIINKMNYINFEDIWDKCMANLYKSVSLFGGLIVNNIPQQTLIQYDKPKMDALIKLSINQDYLLHSSIYPLIEYRIIQILSISVLNQLTQDMSKILISKH